MRKSTAPLAKSGRGHEELVLGRRPHLGDLWVLWQQSSLRKGTENAGWGTVVDGFLFR